MSKVVEQTCRDFGVRYAEHTSVRSGVASHYRWLRQMGMHDGGAKECRYTGIAQPARDDTTSRL